MEIDRNQLPIIRQRLTMELPNPPTFEIMRFQQQSSAPLSKTINFGLPTMPDPTEVQTRPSARESFFHSEDTFDSNEDSTQDKLELEGDGNDPYRCDICGKTFAVPARLTRHYRTHTGEKPYECEFCQKSFSVKENLSVHRRIHTKERPYKCDVCDRAFEHSGKLHRHMRIHTGERPHSCGICGKTFIQSGQLVIHMRTHTGEKPYLCNICSKGFTCSKQLKVHSRTHTGEKPYSCEICGKSFGYNHVLKLHQVAHFGEKVYKCTLCSLTFTLKKSMESHIKIHATGAANGSSQLEMAQSPRMVLTPDGTTNSSSDKENRDSDICSDWETQSMSSGTTPSQALGSPTRSQHIDSPLHLPPTPPSPEATTISLPPGTKLYPPGSNLVPWYFSKEEPKMSIAALPPALQKLAYATRVSKHVNPPTNLPPFSVAGALSVLPEITISTVAGTGTSLELPLLKERQLSARNLDTPLPLTEPPVHLYPRLMSPAALQNSRPYDGGSSPARVERFADLKRNQGPNIATITPVGSKSANFGPPPFLDRMHSMVQAVGRPTSPPTPPSSPENSGCPQNLSLRDLLTIDTKSPSNSIGSGSNSPSPAIGSSLSLPPRKRTRMILDQMLCEKMASGQRELDGPLPAKVPLTVAREESNSGISPVVQARRLNSVIQYAGS